MTVNEFSQVINLAQVGERTRAVRLAANEAERQALMARFDLLSLDMLEAELSLVVAGTDFIASGRFTARLSQACIASGNPVEAVLDQSIHIRFVPQPNASGEFELEPEDCDSMFHDGQTIDLGEAVAQSLGLALDPYPRSPAATQVLKEAGVRSEAEAKPAGALASLKDLLDKR